MYVAVRRIYANKNLTILIFLRKSDKHNGNKKEYKCNP